MRSTEDSDLPEHTQDVGSISKVVDATEVNTLPQAVVDSVTAFDAALAMLRPRILRLNLTISANNYLAAWGAKQDVARAIERVREHLAGIPDGAMRETAMRRSLGVLEIAQQLIACAPNPSPDAIRQARSTDWTADRSIWEREEQEWLTRDVSVDSSMYVIKRPLRLAERELPGNRDASGADPGASRPPRALQLAAGDGDDAGAARKARGRGETQ